MRGDCLSCRHDSTPFEEGRRRQRRRPQQLRTQELQAEADTSLAKRIFHGSKPLRLGLAGVPAHPSIDGSNQHTEDVLLSSDVEEKRGCKSGWFLHGPNAHNRWCSLHQRRSARIWRQLQQEGSWRCLMCVERPPLPQEDHHHVTRYITTKDWELALRDVYVDGRQTKARQSLRRTSPNIYIFFVGSIESPPREASMLRELRSCVTMAPPWLMPVSLPPVSMTT